MAAQFAFTGRLSGTEGKACGEMALLSGATRNT